MHGLVFLLTLGWLLLGSHQALSAPTKPNIVVFLVDDMGIMDTSVPFLTDDSGKPVRHPLNDWYRTPGMERLAARGIRFNNFYAMSVCSPTRISIMTGQNASRHRADELDQPVDQQCRPAWPTGVAMAGAGERGM